MDTRTRAEVKLLNPWAIRPEAMEAILGAASGQRTLEQVRAELGFTDPASAAKDSPEGGAIAVISLRGLITPRGSFLSLLFGGGGGLQAFRASLREALGNSQVKAILLDIDSPGGSSSLVTETATEIRAARRIKRIVAIANTWSASAAYWLGSQATEFIVTPSGQVGSIGAFIVHDDWSGFNEQMGVRPTYIYAGKYKVEGNPDEPLSEEAREDFQRVCDECYEQFIGDVAKGRNITPGTVKTEYGEGRMLTAKRALAAGMVDRVDTYERTLARMLDPSKDDAGSRAEELERTASAEEPQPGDNPESNSEADDETRARIARLVADQPMHL